MSKTDKSRAKYRCPPDLDRWIRVTNCLSYKAKDRRAMRDVLSEIRDKHLDEFVASGFTEATNPLEFVRTRMSICGASQQYVRATFETLISEYELKFIEKHMNSEYGGDWNTGAIELIDAKLILSFIVNFYATYVSAKKRNDRQEMKNAIYTLGKGKIKPTIRTPFGFNKENKLRPVFHPLLDVLIECNLDRDSDRLRLCEICMNIFWAKRKDARTCSSKCANTLRVRRFRGRSDEEKERIKQRRIENRSYKQRMTRKREKRRQ